jgi:hypothetical protein
MQTDLIIYVFVLEKKIGQFVVTTNGFSQPVN